MSTAKFPAGGGGAGGGGGGREGGVNLHNLRVTWDLYNKNSAKSIQTYQYYIVKNSENWVFFTKWKKNNTDAYSQHKDVLSCKFISKSLKKERGVFVLKMQNNF